MSDKKLCVARGRPRGFCVDQALDAALGLFARRGYDGVSIADLAQAMGVNPPSLYAAFGSKRELFARVVELYQQRYGASLPLALEEKELSTAIRRLLIESAAAYTRDADMPGCMIVEGARACTDAEAASCIDARREATRGLIRARIEAARVAEPELLVDYVMTILGGLSLAAREGAEPDRLREVAAISARGFAARLAG